MGFKTKNEYFEIVKKVLVEEMECNPKQVKLNALLKEDLGLDSLESYKGVYALENELKINIPDEIVVELKTVSDIMKTLQYFEKKGKRDYTEEVRDLGYKIYKISMFRDSGWIYKEDKRLASYDKGKIPEIKIDPYNMGAEWMGEYVIPFMEDLQKKEIPYEILEQEIFEKDINKEINLLENKIQKKKTLLNKLSKL